MKGIESVLIAFLSIFVGITLGSWLAFISIPRFPIDIALGLTLIDAIFVLLIISNQKNKT